MRILLLGLLAVFCLAGCQSEESEQPWSNSASPKPEATLTTSQSNPEVRLVRDQQKNKNAVEEADLERSEEDNPEFGEEFFPGMEVMR